MEKMNMRTNAELTRYAIEKKADLIYFVVFNLQRLKLHGYTAFTIINVLYMPVAEQKQAKEKTLQYIMMAIEEIRKLSKELVMPQLKEQGLVDGIQSLIDDINLTHKVQFKFIHNLNTDLLSSGKKITLFRIVQEQAKNILTHSKAKMQK
jgi:signal transduction histidine kinase